MVALQARREQGTHPTRRATASPDRGDARARELPEGVRGAPSGGRPAAVTPHAALSRSEGDSRQPPCGDVVSSRAPPAAAAETYVPCGQPARCTCRSDPPRPARSASTRRGPPRYSAGCRGYPATPRRRAGRRARAAAIERRARRSRGRSKSFLRVGGRRGAATAWLCPPQRHKHASGCRRGCDWARRDLGCRRPQHARGLLWARVWAAPLDWTARCGRRNPVGYARFAPPAVTPAIAVTPRNNPCVTCVTRVTRRMYVCMGDGKRGPKFH